MEIYCTLGPASFKPDVIKKLTRLGVSLFRINMSHTMPSDLPKIIELIRSNSNVPICLDSEGAQVRTGTFGELDFILSSNETLFFPSYKVDGSKHEFNLYPLNIVDELLVGDLLSIDFHAVLVRIVEKRQNGVLAKVINGGKVGRNKAVSVDRIIKMPALTVKDIEAMKIGRDFGIKHVALSFANFSEDVKEMRRHCLDGTHIIAKIECQNGLTNLDKIILEADSILIDRGDLSREVPIQTIPMWQKKIILSAKLHGKKTFVATNLLESMVTAPIPTRAEVNDVYNTISDQAAGLVLAAETAIGNYPIECVAMLKKVIESVEKGAVTSGSDYLIEPHGGKLVQHFFDGDVATLKNLPKITPSIETLYDCEQIAMGTFSPISGFMGKEELFSVLKENQFLSGVTWTMPIVFQITQKMKEQIGHHDQVILCSNDGALHSLLEIKEIYQVDIESILLDWFGTTDTGHPGVKRVKSLGGIFVAGQVKLIEKNKYFNQLFSLSPRQLRRVFSTKGWIDIVGFHTRNIPHMAHEFIQNRALEVSGADGLLISPVIGPKKEGDFVEEIVMKTYEKAILDGHFPSTKTVLSGFNTYSRYAGPREAIFTALCRKNMGCSHFVVGRDHTGVGNFYGPYAAHKAFEKFDTIGIQPIFFQEIGYNSNKNCYEEVISSEKYLSISGSAIREAIQNKKAIPEWAIRSGVQTVLHNELEKGVKLFH